MPSQLRLPRGTTEVVLRHLFPEEVAYIDDPVGWIKDKLGENLWSRQSEVCESVAKNRYTAVRSCHDVGKSYVAARLIAWWLDVHPVGEAFAVSTAPTAAQVEAILWREVGKAHRKGNLAGYITGGSVPSWKIDSEIVGYGRKPADYDQAAFQGIHAKYVLVIIDESCGVPKALFDAVDSLATNEYSRVLAIGNPDDPSAHFAKICAPGSGWHNIQISAFDWFEEMDEYPELQPYLVSKQWVTERKKRWGVESPIYVSKVLGEFPDISDDVLITPRMLREACERDLPGIGVGQFGADVARYGQDESVVYRNRDGVLRLVAAWGKKSTMETAGKIAEIMHPRRLSVPAVVDVIGVGAGVYDRLAEQGYLVVPFNAAERALNPKKFKNRRSEVFWTFRELCEDGEIDLDPEDEDLLGQLGAIKWTVDSSGRIVVEPKAETIKRLGVSPDRADAAVYSTVRGQDISEFKKQRKAKARAGVTDDLLERAM